MGRPNLSRETKFSGANGDGEMFIFSVQLTSSRIGTHTRLIHALSKCGLNAYILYCSARCFMDVHVFGDWRSRGRMTWSSQH